MPENPRLEPQIRDLGGRNLLVRADLNVPLVPGTNKIADDTKLRKFLPTLRELLEINVPITVLSHLGRPDGKPENFLSLYPVSQALEKLLQEQESEQKVPVHFFPEPYILPGDWETIPVLQPGEILLRENLRFHPGETQNDIRFAHLLAQGHDVLLNDAFACSHRKHASLDAIRKYIRVLRGPGLRRETADLRKTLENLQRPLLVLVGGAKISGKIETLKVLAQQADTLILSGSLANPFLENLGLNLGIVGEDHREYLGIASEIAKIARKNHCVLFHPEDAILEGASKSESFPLGRIPPGARILDSGARSVQRIQREIRKAKSLIWNGPLGRSETHPEGTLQIAQFLREPVQEGEISVLAGGGETLACLRKGGVLKILEESEHSHCTPAGGAFLHWLQQPEQSYLWPEKRSRNLEI